MKFSIIIPTYNRSHTIKRAINSIVSQTYKNWEMIIVDDGSTDNTYDIIKPFLNDKRIKYYKLNKNQGVGKARNFGLKKISKDTTWITFLDSDDIFIKNALELMIRKIKEFPNIKYFCFSTKYENGKDASKIKKDNLIGNYEIVLGKNNLIYGEFCTLLHKDIIKKGFKFEEKVNGYEWIAWLRLAKKNVKQIYTKTVTRIYIRDSGDSLIRTKIKNKKYYKNVKKGIEIIMKEFGKDLKKVNKKKFALYLYTLAYANIMLNYKKLSFIQTLNAMKLDPFNIRFIRNIIVILFKSLKDFI